MRSHVTFEPMEWNDHNQPSHGHETHPRSKVNFPDSQMCVPGIKLPPPPPPSMEMWVAARSKLQDSQLKEKFLLTGCTWCRSTMLIVLSVPQQSEALSKLSTIKTHPPLMFAYIFFFYKHSIVQWLVGFQPTTGHLSCSLIICPHDGCTMAFL